MNIERTAFNILHAARGKLIGQIRGAVRHEFPPQRGENL